MRAIRPVLILALAAVSLVPGIGNASHNLAPNPGFELSPTGPAGDVSKQPLLPTGWAFEGAAGLFDHTENAKHGGKRAIAISIPASTNRKICQQDLPCQDSPLTLVTDAADPAYSVGPFWRTAMAIPVTGGSTYSLKVWVAMDLATVGAGATTKVRWLDANGVPIKISKGPKRVQAESDPALLPFEQITGSVTAPSNAKGAILMLGAIDDLFISQIKFDDVSFSTSH